MRFKISRAIKRDEPRIVLLTMTMEAKGYELEAAKVNVEMEKVFIQAEKEKGK